MATMAAPRKSIHDYPEHLNPFHEDDNHNKIRFWTLGRKLNRSNSISFSGIKDLKNSWAFRSFIKKGKKGQETSSRDKSSSQVNGDTSPIVYRRTIQYSSPSASASRSTVGSPERYVYGGSITPLPRSRFQERMRSPSHLEVNSLSATPRMARSEVSGSRLSVESTNPFDEGPVPPVRASRRKKKRAPQPPAIAGLADISVSSETSEFNITEDNENNNEKEKELEEMNLNIELKIVEDEDVEQPNSNVENTTNSESTGVTSMGTVIVSEDFVQQKYDGNDLQITEKGSDKEELTATERNIIDPSSENQTLNSVSFPKVDIVKYRRNSSVDEDDIRLRRGNLEDFHALKSKRSKSLNNNLDTTYLTYDINLNDNLTMVDTNGNEPRKVVCKVYDENSRKHSIDTISSTEKEFLEIDKATRELEREIRKLNSALIDDDISSEGTRLSVSEIKRRFDKNDVSSPNPIPKPRRSHYGGSNSP